MLVRPNSARLRVAVATALAVGMIFYFFGLLAVRVQAAMASRNLTPAASRYSDLYGYWLGTRNLLLEGRDPYSAETTRAIQIGSYGHVRDPALLEDPNDEHRFVYPIYVCFLLAPLAPLRFPVVQILACVILGLLTGLSLRLWAGFAGVAMQGSTAVIATLLWMTSTPVLQGLYLQQVSLLVAALLAVAAAMLVRGHLALAGVLLGIATVKPQMVCLVIAWLGVWALSRWKERKRLLAAFISTMLILLVASEWLLPGWFLRWWEGALAWRRFTEPSLIDQLFGRSGGPVASLFLLAWCAVPAWHWRREPAGSPGFVAVFALLLTMSVVFSPNADTLYNHVLLLPSVLFVALGCRPALVKTRAGRALWALTAMLLLWQWLGALGFSVAAAIMGREAISRSAFLLLPVLTAPAVPFAVLALQGVCCAQLARERSPVGDTVIPMASRP